MLEREGGLAKTGLSRKLRGLCRFLFGFPAIRKSALGQRVAQSDKRPLDPGRTEYAVSGNCPVPLRIETCPISPLRPSGSPLDFRYADLPIPSYGGFEIGMAATRKPDQCATIFQPESGSNSFIAVAVSVVVFPRSFWRSTPSWLIMKVIIPESPYCAG
jgi:hypothetical protein